MPVSPGPAPVRLYSSPANLVQLDAMEQLARARIVMWEGGSLWLLTTPWQTAETPPRTGFHAHHAVQIVFGLGGRFRLWTADNELSGLGVAVAPDVPHRFDAEGPYAILFVEPESRAGRAIIAATFGDGGLTAMQADRLEALGDLLSVLGAAPAPDRDELVTLGRALIDRLAGDRRHDVLDPRVAAVVDLAGRDQGEQVTLDDAAAVAGLSASRLSHLFVEQTGLSFKTYRLWIRLTRAVRLMAEGLTLTAAAHEAGFSDSAHFSRTFRRMFGIAPASLKLV